MKSISHFSLSKKLKSIRFDFQFIMVLLFFGGLLLAGLRFYPDFGVAWDEPSQVQIGQVNYTYILKHNPELLSYKDRYYGPIYELILLRLTTNADPRSMYLGRHLVNFLFFFGGVLVFFGLARRIFHNTWLALLASACLVLSPRIFADAFYNSKDIPFMVAMIFALYSQELFLEKSDGRRAMLHAVTSAFLIAIRVAGVFIPLLTLGWLAAGWIFGRANGRPEWRQVWFAGLYLIATAGLTVLFWPVLWHDPLGEFRNALAQMSQYPWWGTVLYLGQFLKIDAIPWHYIPVWIAISTPYLYLAGFLAGVAAIPISLMRGSGKWYAGEKRIRLTLLACVAGPLLAEIGLHATLYDAWRQMFFIYPAIILIAVFGMVGVGRLAGRGLSGRVLAPAAGILLALGLIEPLSFMWQNHPNENVYFNRLAGGSMSVVKQRFDLDYWGISFKQGFDYILAHDTSASIPIYVDPDPGLDFGYNILTADQKKRLVPVETADEAHYLITNYRWHPQDYPYPQEVFNVKVGDASILSVFDLRAEPGYK